MCALGSAVCIAESMHSYTVLKTLNKKISYYVLGSEYVNATNMHAALRTCMLVPSTHAKNKSVARFIPFSLLGFWVKSTGICAGALPYRRDFTATTRM